MKAQDTSIVVEFLNDLIAVVRAINSLMDRFAAIDAEREWLLGEQYGHDEPSVEQMWLGDWEMITFIEHYRATQGLERLRLESQLKTDLETLIVQAQAQIKSHSNTTKFVADFTGRGSTALLIRWLSRALEWMVKDVAIDRTIYSAERLKKLTRFEKLLRASFEHGLSLQPTQQRKALFQQEAARRVRRATATIAPSDTDQRVSDRHKQEIRPTKNKLKKLSRKEIRLKLVSTLTKHHQYAEDGCLNTEPIGSNELARLAEVSTSTASAFFNREFNHGKSRGHAKYRAKCQDEGTLADALKALRGEFTPAEISQMTLDAFEAGRNLSDD